MVRVDETLHVLFYGAFNGNTALVKRALDSGANVNCMDMAGMTPLAYAVYGWHVETAAYLISRGADVNKPSLYDMRNELYLFILYRPEMDFEPLTAPWELQCPAFGKKGHSPLMTAIHVGCAEAFEMLLKAGAWTDYFASDLTYPLLLAADKGDEYMVTALLKKEKDAAQKYAWSEAGIICTAVAHGRLNVAKRLLEAGFNPNEITYSGATPLAVAVEHNRREMVSLLLKWGANTRLRPTFGGRDMGLPVDNAKDPVIEKMIRAAMKVKK